MRFKWSVKSYTAIWLYMLFIITFIWTNYIPRLPIFSYSEGENDNSYELRRRVGSPHKSGRKIHENGAFPWEDFVCRWSVPKMMESSLHMNVFIRDVEPTPSVHHIFLLDTGCLDALPNRHLCALESYALLHPESEVWMLVTVDALDDSDGLLSTLVRSYGNIRLAALDLNLLFLDTPLAGFYTTHELLESRYINVQMSDMARVALVWRYGGFYSDNDVIALSSISDLSNAIAFENNRSIANALFHFEAKHEFLVAVMNYMPAHFAPGEWTSIGPQATTAAALEICNERSALPYFDDVPSLCRDVTLLPEKIFYPLPWTYFKKLFETSLAGSFQEAYPNTRALHFTGSSSDRVAVDVVESPTSVYVQAATHRCPDVFSTATRRSRFF